MKQELERRSTLEKKNRSDRSTTTAPLGGGGRLPGACPGIRKRGGSKSESIFFFFFFFAFQFLGGAQAPWAPLPGHAPDSPTLPCLAPLRSVDSLLKMANNTALRRGDCRNSSLGDHSFAISASVRLYNN